MLASSLSAIPSTWQDTFSGLIHESILPFALHDLGVSLLSFIAASLWLFIWQQFSRSKILASSITRKIVHVTCAPLFMVLWPLYSSETQDPYVRVIAALVPIIVSIRLIMTAYEMIPQDNLARAMSRTGNPKEGLRGPLYYVLILASSILVFWTSSPAAFITLCQMCFGDGMAEVFGRKWGKYTSSWEFNKSKSYAGTIGFVICGFLSSIVYLTYFNSVHITDVNMQSAWGSLLAISILCSLVETIPFGDDNITVPIAAAISSYLLFH